mgnify:CR=1 FL=1
MNTFEKTYHRDPSREKDHRIEIHTTIELSDQEHLERLTPPSVSKEMQDAGFIYKPPEEEAMFPALKEKFEKARKITKDTKAIKLGQKDAKSKSKSTEKKPKKVSSKPNKPAMARLQKKL